MPNVLLKGEWGTINLALMKVSAYYKKKGCCVFLDTACDPDLVFISCMFSQSKEEALKIANQFSCPVYIGGYGVNSLKLPPEIEHLMPDYDLYGIDFSVGYTSRGCNRKCGFCVIPKMEGRIRDHAPIAEFLHSNHNKLVLYDNNFLASPKWKENLQFLIDRQINIDFGQGLDLRLINDENAEMLSKVNFAKWNIKKLRFSWDNIKGEKAVVRGIKTLVKHGIKPQELIVYMLVGFDSTFSEDMHRFKVLSDLRVVPYPMYYNDTKDELLRVFGEWVRNDIYKSCKWEDYKPARRFLEKKG